MFFETHKQFEQPTYTEELERVDTTKTYVSNTGNTESILSEETIGRVSSYDDMYLDEEEMISDYQCVSTIPLHLRNGDLIVWQDISYQATQQTIEQRRKELEQQNQEKANLKNKRGPYRCMCLCSM